MEWEAVSSGNEMAFCVYPPTQYLVDVYLFVRKHKYINLCT